MTYGITEEKRKKYCRRVGKLIKLYNDPASPDYRDVELLRQRLRAFTSRVVYVSKYSSGNVWKVKGFISNYSELRYFEDNKTLEKYGGFFEEYGYKGVSESKNSHSVFFDNVYYK